MDGTLTAHMQREMHLRASCTVASLCTNCFVTKKTVLTSGYPYSKGPLQSGHSDWLPIALSLHQKCHYNQWPYKEKLRYLVWHMHVSTYSLNYLDRLCLSVLPCVMHCQGWDWGPGRLVFVSLFSS